MTQTPRPVQLKKEGDDYLVIDWSDGARTRIGWKALRSACPCATCNEERRKPSDPFRILKPEELTPLKAVALAPVGHYAYKFTWSDGHDTGIYSLELLRSLGSSEPRP